jgi:hypothetical protein
VCLYRFPSENVSAAEMILPPRHVCYPSKNKSQPDNRQEEVVEVASLLPVSSTLLLGLRHGIDWDHLAAIADITGAQDSRKAGLLLSFCYAAGHGAVLLLLGTLAIMVGFSLPPVVDEVMEPFVGATLIALSAWLLYTLVANPDAAVSSKAKLLQALYVRLRGKTGEAEASPPSIVSCLGIGAIHGIGAETPTQMAALCAMTAVGGQAMGIAMLAAFVFGIFVSNMIVAGLAVSGYNKIGKGKAFGRGLVMLTAIFSFFVGALFLLRHSGALPEISGA